MRPVRPVRRYRQPVYPTRLQVLDDQQLLARNMPRAWLGNPDLSALVGVLMAVGTAGVSCASDSAAGSTAPAVAAVAPIFEHGQGRGVMGCVVVSPPVFLSEEEALQVMREELAELGVAVGPTTRSLAGLEGEDVADLASAEGDSSQVVLEYVSSADFFKLGGQRSGSTVQTYDLRGLANRTARLVQESADGDGATYGIFYDPMVRLEHDWDGAQDYTANRIRAKAEARRLLRQQVRDFADWLLAQGVI